MDQNDAHLAAIYGRYGHIHYFRNDQIIGKSLEQYGEWAELELSFCASLIAHGDVVLDIGSYIGTHALAFARYVGLSGHVHAFEPQMASFDVLRRNLEVNAVAQVTAHHAAVGDSARTLFLKPLALENAHNFGSFIPTSENLLTTESSPCAVKQITVDSLGLSRCNFVKIDVEGMEASVALGATQTLRQCQPIVYGECNSVQSGYAFLSVLKDLGYSCMMHVVNAYNPDNYFNRTENIFGRSREVAIVGVPQVSRGRLHPVVRLQEALYPVETLDDMVYVMLQKPQYGREVLTTSAAGQLSDDIVQEVEIDVGRAEAAIGFSVLQEERNTAFNALIAANRHVKRIEATKERISASLTLWQDRAVALEAALREQQDLVVAQEAALREQDDLVVAQEAALREQQDRAVAQEAALMQQQVRLEEHKQAQAALEAGWQGLVDHICVGSPLPSDVDASEWVLQKKLLGYWTKVLEVNSALGRDIAFYRDYLDKIESDLRMSNLLRKQTEKELGMWHEMDRHRGRRFQFVPRLMRMVTAIGQERPNELFDPAWYGRIYQSTIPSDLDPWTHYIQFGRHHNYKPNALFDPSWYKSEYIDLVDDLADPLDHYSSIGHMENRNPHPLFDTKWYCEFYGDVRNSGMNPLAHFFAVGVKEDRSPSPRFDTEFYRQQHKDVKENVCPVLHYIEYGHSEKRSIAPVKR